ncbi:uncharacterized protein BXZ73DRAFT_47269 [Epithele typhae]|uniref:uncharacterized protein n=1 Tax=Epithele typhae TaxID=378194 RepID=UPI0020079020|nr:uncharacterized protein BXZ73DRAFT_47269 [Epithele typhae]KAH9931636.1 hypothetical protein BXZ73DRAFT_47269 [Epithele typhae]
MSAAIAAILLLSPDNPCNTTVVDDATSKALYVVRTEHPKSGTVTRGKHEDEIASLEWKSTRSDRVTLTSFGGPMSLREWLHPSLIPFRSEVSWKDRMGRKYKWRGNEPGRQLELYSEDDGFASLIARFKRVHRDDAGVEKSACLLFTARGIEVRDDAVVSFLFLERARREHETTVVRTADSLAAGAAVGSAVFNVKA